MISNSCVISSHLLMLILPISIHLVWKVRSSSKFLIILYYYPVMVGWLLLWYSSKATWYLHACCRLKILGWRLHHMFNIWMGACYARTRTRQIIGCVHPQMFHLFWMNFLMKFNLNGIYTMNLWILYLYVPSDPWMDCPTEKLLMCSCMQYLMPYCLVKRMDLA